MQGELSLNLLRNSRANPRLSAWSYLFGNWDFNANPLAPPGTKVVFHNKPEVRSTWDMRGLVGFYIAPAPHHYRCVKLFKEDTRKEIITDTIKFVPHKIPIPSVSADDAVMKACDDIKEILLHHNNQPILSINPSTQDALHEVASNLHQKIKLKKIKTPSTPMTTSQQEKTNASVPRVHQKPVAPHTSASLPRVKLPTTSNQRNTIGRARLPAYQHTPFIATRNMHLQLLTLLSDDPIKRPRILPRHKLAHIFDIDTGRKESIDSLLQKNHLRWSRSLSNEWGQLAQGNKYGVKATDKIDFISKNDVPQNAKVTYASFVCDHRPLKPEPYRVRIVVGGDKLTYAYDSRAPAASLLETKLILNSTISDCDKGARFFTADVKDFFLATPMKDAEYMKVPFKYFPSDIIDKYNLRTLMTHDKYIYIKIKKGMYGLKQAAVLAYQQLVKNLGQHGYYPADMTNGIWRHVSRRTRFCLCVDDLE